MSILSTTLKKIYNAIDLETLRKRAEILNGFERNYGQANFKKSAFCCQQFMLASGLQNVQMLPIPCDGKTANLDYIIPQAWDRTGRSFLKIEDKSLSCEDAMICDTDKTPFAAGMWSMPTPPEGIHAEIVDWDTLDPENPDVKGKFVLITHNSYRNAYLSCVEHKAAALIVSDSAAPEETYDEIRWSNGLGKIGWYHTKEDKRGIIFCITPRKADFIRSLLAKGKPVKAHGVMNTKVYDDELYTVTGTIPGLDSKEILLIAHIYEPFLADDAAGAAQAIATACAIRDLVAKKQLPPLKHTLRVMISMERYGFSGWFAKKANVKNTLHVFSFDSTCHAQYFSKGRYETNLRTTADSAPSFTDYIIRHALQQYKTKLHFNTERGNLSDDTFMQGPLMNIPANWLHNSDRKYHHNSGWQFSDIIWDLAHISSSCLGLAVGVLATFRKEDFMAIRPELEKTAHDVMRECAEQINDKIRNGAITPEYAAEKFSHLSKVAVQKLLAVSTYQQGIYGKAAAAKLPSTLTTGMPDMPSGKTSAPAKKTEAAIARAKGIVIEPIQPSSIHSQAKIPQAKRIEAGEFDTIYGQCDGIITLYEAIRRTEYTKNDVQYSNEQIRKFIDIAKTFEKYGYLRIRSTGEK